MVRTSTSDEFEYKSVVSQAVNDEDVFQTFKRHDWYRPILEHVSYEYGLGYLDVIKQDYPYLLEKIEKYRENDIIGSPVTNLFEVGEMSPTTLRYMKVMGDLNHHFGSLDGLDIVEIGCGYGGQCKIVTDTNDVKSYTLIDLPEVLELTKKYLERLGTDMSKLIFKDINQLADDENYDLFISNYGYTECFADVRAVYLQKVVYKSRMGYLTANAAIDPDVLDQEITNRFEGSFKIDEKPYTGHLNFILIWK